MQRIGLFHIFTAMKKLTLFFAAFVLTLSTALAQDAMPDVVIKTLDGASVAANTLATGEGPSVVAFWATWCSPCKKELDAYAEYYDDWKEDMGVEVYAVTIDTRRALSKVKPMVETKGWEFPILSDANSELMQALNFQTIPQVYILDKEGNIVYSHSGYVPGDEYEIEEKLKALTRG